jgi:hypothetical protein
MYGVLIHGRNVIVIGTTPGSTRFDLIHLITSHHHFFAYWIQAKTPITPENNTMARTPSPMVETGCPAAAFFVDVVVEVEDVSVFVPVSDAVVVALAVAVALSLSLQKTSR